LLGSLLVLRLFYLPFFCSAYDLAGDESYYWAWGQRPDWCYFSKPPMIGWLMGFVGAMTGNSEWGIRLAALLLGTASLMVLYFLAKRIFNPRVAIVTLLLAAFTPANVALHLFLTIDAPLVLFWGLALWFFWNAVEQPEKSSHWLCLTLAIGAGVLTKQMMLVFPLLMIVFLLFSVEKIDLLGRLSFWLCVLSSLLFMLPVLWWNQQHGWITLEHTSHHFDVQDKATLLHRAGTFFSFPASQAGLMTPLSWFLIMAIGFASLWKWRSLELRARFLMIFSAPALLVFLLLALRQSINPNWPAVFYLSGTILVAGTLDGALRSPVHWLSPRWLKPTLITAAGLFFLALVVPAVLLLAQPRKDPMSRLRGWQEAGKQVEGLLQKTPRPQQTFLLALGHRENASQLCFYTPQHPPTYRWQPDGSIASQYEIWPSAGERLGQDALILQPTAKPLMQILIRSFASIEKLEDIHVDLGNGESRHWQVFLGHQLKSWPAKK
jgi:4-amino-4-deoxy-L-arabinose transferase-like glycosyltransferase